MIRPARLLIALSSLAALANSALAADAPLSLGSPAPKMDVKTWVKGTPVNEFKNDKLYVVEFWATWCGPCKMSIPHLTELAHKNKDVTFVGVSIWEDHTDNNIEKFVADMGDKMDYNVGYSGNKEGMAKTWMEAAGRNGIPSAFIVKEGKIVWEGHPMEMEKPLADIKAGTYDMAAAKKQIDAEAAEARAQMELNKQLTAIVKQFDAGQKTEAHAALNKLVAENPKLKRTGESIEFGWLATEDPAAWNAKAKTMLASKDQQQISQVLSVVYSKAREGKDTDFVRSTINSALDATEWKDMLVLQYANAIAKSLKDDKMQLAVTNKILDVLPASELKDNADFKAAMVKQKAELEAKQASASGN